MSRQGLTLLTILLSAAAGGLIGLAVNRSQPTATPAGANAAATLATSATPAPSLAPGPEVSAMDSVSPGAAEPAAAAGGAESGIAAGGGPGAGAGGGLNVAAGGAQSGASAQRAAAFDLTAPATESALIESQVACNRKSPEDCERAALALESGNTGARDPARARGLRRIALTLYVKQCETASRVLACARLAEMYEKGELVQPNSRNAAALRQRVDELCAKRSTEPGCSR